MDVFYDRTAAVTTLDKIIAERTSQNSSNVMQLYSLKRGDISVIECAEPTAYWTLVNSAETKPSEPCIVRVQGILCAKMLPPITKPRSLSSMQRLRPHIKQSITISGLGSALFEQCTRNMEKIYMSFLNAIPGDTLDGFCAEQVEDFEAITARTRYFDRRPGAQSIGFTTHEDPHGVLASMECDGFVHTVDNAVEYVARHVDESRQTAVYKNISPTALNIGDIVEISIGFAAYAKADSNFVFVPHLKGILNLSQEQREKAAILRMRSRFSSKLASSDVKKRKALYPDEEAIEDTRAKISRLAISNTNSRMETE